jgi:hypothetical protein
MSEIPEYQWEVVEWKDPDRKELIFQSESFNDLIQACNFMHHTLHKQKGYTEIRRIQNNVMVINDDTDLEKAGEQIIAWLEKQESTSH